MQFLEITQNLTLKDLSRMVGRQNVEKILHQNGVTRQPNIGQAFYSMCQGIISRTLQPVTVEQKVNFLSTLTGNSDIFERFAEGTEDDWKVCITLNTFPGLLSIPASVVLPSTDKVLGNGIAVAHAIYRKVVEKIRSNSSVSEVTAAATGIPATTALLRSPIPKSGLFNYQNFHIPWGKISLYSSLSGDHIDFPTYPKEWNDGRKANYSTMPDLLYQYEPWQIYQSSGPRSNTYTFDFHRDMWTGDHRDGKANEMIRFCEACCYPEYRGAAVYTTTVSLYIHGQNLITGVLTDVKVAWDTESPIGYDGVPLHGELSIEITEVSNQPLDYSTVKALPLIG